MRKEFWHTIATALLLAPAPMWTGTPPAAPAFEVASIKPSAPIDRAQVMAGKLHIGLAVDGARVDIGNLSLRDLLWHAYRVRPYQISGPDWLGGQRFDIAATLPEGASSDQVPEMLQALLAERFKLVVHRESKEQSVYALVVGKNGPKLKASEAETAAADAPVPAPQVAGNSQISISHDAKGVTLFGGGRLGSGPTHVSMGANGLRLETSRITMDRFAELITSFADRPVVDMTGLKGDYDITLDLTMDELRSLARSAGVMMPFAQMHGGEPGMQAAPTASDPSGGSVFTDVEHLGLKLESRKDQLTTIVVDHVEKMPTEN